MDNLNDKALEKLRETLGSKTLEEIATLTGFRKEKIHQWERLNKFASLKVAKKILRTL